MRCVCCDEDLSFECASCCEPVCAECVHECKDCTESFCDHEDCFNTKTGRCLICQADEEEDEE